MELTKFEEKRYRMISISFAFFSVGVFLLLAFFLNIESSLSIKNERPLSQSAFALEFGRSNEISAAKGVTIKPGSVLVKGALAQNIEKSLLTKSNNQTQLALSQPESFNNNEMGQYGSNDLGEGNTLGFNLPNRKMILVPQVVKGSLDEGIVVVEIAVNEEGKVIEATANGRGTTTSNADLKRRAKEIAFSVLFDKVDGLKEQRGTITVIFSFD